MSVTAVQAQFESVVELIRQNLVDDEVEYGPGVFDPTAPQYEQPVRMPLTTNEVAEINARIDAARAALDENQNQMFSRELLDFFGVIERGEHKFNHLLGNGDQPVNEALAPVRCHSTGVCLRRAG